ncbi:hypothetical protein ACFPM0_28465 [Pseudonocardia sulfidoxydans]|uniref:hypothetical protein n=1 Tax=Pseudonocardia sulfidoxydans TaxID=54011 RepID=UPI003606AFC1
MEPWLTRHPNTRSRGHEAMTSAPIHRCCQCEVRSGRGSGPGPEPLRRPGTTLFRVRCGSVSQHG